MPLNRRSLLLASAAAAAAVAAPGLQAQPAFDHSHAAWTALLRRHVVLLRNGQASEARYAAFQADRAALKAYLARLSAVTAADFQGFGKAQQMAFLINAYNAFTVELILTKYPALKSIKELGSLFSSPWKPAWIDLLGDKVSLDGIEHSMLRARGRYDDPRIHFAVNCASIGCPMLREEAFTPERLDAQLDEQALRFLSDRTRNRYEPKRGRMEVSKIFDWYGEDFRIGHRGIMSLQNYLAGFADVLADAPADRDRVRSAALPIAFLDYDWALNDAR